MVIREPKCEPKIVFWGGILSRLPGVAPMCEQCRPTIRLDINILKFVRISFCTFALL